MSDIKIDKKIEQITPQTENLPQPEVVESNQEQLVENISERTLENTESIANEIIKSVGTVKADLPTTNSSEVVLTKVEEVLADNLDTVFLSMDPVQQQKFKLKGEETAKKITVLLNSAKATVGKIIELITEWLRLIPKVNKHFLEQEAKIKADQIMEMYLNKKV